MRNPFLRAFLLLAAWGLGPASSPAQTWTESVDAPDTIPGQLTVGVGPLTTIQGAIVNPDVDVDVYCIRITTPTAFSAVVTASAADTTSLFLFDAAALGVTHDGGDDGPFGPNPGYQPSLSSAFVPNVVGTYWLAITHSGRDAEKAGLEMWLDQPTIESPPTGPGAPGPLSGWTFPGFGLDGAYTISLAGTQFCQGAGGECCDPCVLGTLLAPYLPKRPTYATTHPCHGTVVPQPVPPECCTALDALRPLLAARQRPPGHDPCTPCVPNPNCICPAVYIPVACDQGVFPNQCDADCACATNCSPL